MGEQVVVKKLSGWSCLDSLFVSKRYNDISNFIQQQKKSNIIFPAQKNIFKAFKLSSFEKTKVIILGQDPYHNKNQAIGLSFAVSETEKLPPSLRNIFIEMKSDIGEYPKNGDLSYLAKQGVLLLNTTLTVGQNKPNSHSLCGWQEFTDEIITTLSSNKKNLVFILWGANAQKKIKLINHKKHLVLTSSHPSPFSARKGFFGSKHFSKTNEYLLKNNLELINWYKQ